MLNKNNEFFISSWKDFPSLQQPNYSDLNELLIQKEKLKSLPPLVDHEEIEELRKQLIECENNNQFMIQIGDCAEMFKDCTSQIIDDKMNFIRECSDKLENYIKKPILKVGRIAGQYAKPRSSDYETIEGEKVLSYKGDMINSIEKNDREPNPKRMTEAYFHASTTLNYMKINEIYKSQSDSENKNGFNQNISSNKIYSSHEGMLLDFEECLTRKASNNNIYDLSAHFLWIGERTRNPDHGHINFFQTVRNPLGLKIGNLKSEEEFLKTFFKLNPNNEKGKLVIILRLGLKNVEEILPKIIEIKRKNNLNFLWMSDPMHGNTTSENGIKTRHYDNVLKELSETAKFLKENGENLGGIHLEGSPYQITECLGGKTNSLEPRDLNKRYLSQCDPRLNHQQCLDLIKEIKNYLI